MTRTGFARFLCVLLLSGALLSPAGANPALEPGDRAGFQLQGQYQSQLMRMLNIYRSKSEDPKQNMGLDESNKTHYVPDDMAWKYRLKFAVDPADGINKAWHWNETTGGYEVFDSSRLTDPQTGKIGFVLYVMDAAGNLYVAHEDFFGGKRTHHSSVPSGRNVAGAGHLKVVNGIPVYIDNKSGHYVPYQSRLMNTLEALSAHGFSLDPDNPAQVVLGGIDDRDTPRPINTIWEKAPPESRMSDERLKTYIHWDPTPPPTGLIKPDPPPSDGRLSSPPPPPAPQPPPSNRTYGKIEAKIRETPVGSIDKNFMIELYKMDEKAAGAIGDIMADPSLSAKNKKMGRIRKEMDLEAWDKVLEATLVRPEMTNQGRSNGVRSDHEYTLYYIAEETGHSIDEVIALHKQAWQDVHKQLTPDRLEITVQNGDHFYPDWRNESLRSGDLRLDQAYQNKVKEVMLALRRNPEAYFVPGANREQVHNRALLEGITHIYEYDPLAPEGERVKLIERGLAREVATRYVGLHPQNDYKNVLGNLIQNPREFFKNLDGGTQNSTRRIKYLNRAVNGGNVHFAVNNYLQLEETYRDWREGRRRSRDQVELTRKRKNELQTAYLKQALGSLNLDDHAIAELKMAIDVGMAIELDKSLESGGDYAQKRKEYFRPWEAEAARLVGDIPDPKKKAEMILAEQERLFMEVQKRVLATFILAGLEFTARRDLTPEGALRNALKFEKGPDGRPKATFAEARIRNVAFDRAVEVALLFEFINSSQDPVIRALAGDVIASAPTSEVRSLYEALSTVTTAQIDNWLKGEEGEGGLQRTFRDFLDEKIKLCRDRGIDLVPLTEAERMISDDELRQRIAANRAEKLNPVELTALREVWQTARTTTEGWVHESWSKANGLMVGSSTVNLIRAYQTGDETIVKRTLVTEAINYMPDFIEIPFTITDVLLGSQTGNTDPLWDLGLMGAMYLAADAAPYMLAYNIVTGSYQIARTYINTTITEDLVEQAFRSRPCDRDGDRFLPGVRARRNPFKDSPDLFRGETPIYPIFYKTFPLPEDAMSDRELERMALWEWGGKFAKDLKKEGLTKGTPEYESRVKDLAQKYGFDTPFYHRLRKVYEHYQPKVGRYITGARTWVGEQGVEDVALTKFFTEEVMRWYEDQPAGYQVACQGDFQAFFGDQEKEILEKLIAQCIIYYKSEEEIRGRQEDAQREVPGDHRALMNLGSSREKQLLATGEKLKEKIQVREAAAAEQAAQEAQRLAEQYTATARISYPFTYATQEYAPTLNVDVRSLISHTSRELEADIKDVAVALRDGAPAGWEPGEAWKDRFEPDEDGLIAYHPVTVDHEFTLTVTDVADGAVVATDRLTLPMVYYMKRNPPFSGSVSVKVKGGTESGDPSTYPVYVNAEVTVNGETGKTGMFGFATFGGLDVGSHQAEAKPRPDDEYHEEAVASFNLVDPLASPDGSGSEAVDIEIVLPYSPPPEPGEESASGGNGGEPGGGSGNGGGGGGNGGGGGGNGGGGGGSGGGGGGGGGGSSTPDPTEVIRQIGPLVSPHEQARDQAKAECKYAAALAAHDQVIAVVQEFLARMFPGGVPPRVQAAAERFQVERASLARAADAERQAQDLLRTARSQLLSNEIENALDSVERALLVPNLPTCLHDKIRSMYGRMKADVTALSDRIKEVVIAANADCDYERALKLAEGIKRDSPNLSWVRDEMPKIAELAAKQKLAKQGMKSARKHAARGDQQVQNGNPEGARAAYTEALRLANQALIDSPACGRDAIRGFLADVARRREGPAQVKVDRSLILLIDTSGSMGSGGKIDHAKAAARMAVNELGQNVEIALIAYDGSCQQRFSPRQEFTTHKESVLRAIDTLGPGGGTPMSTAIGYATWYMENKGRGKSGQILLLCDGQDSCGKIREAGDSVRRSTFGIRLDAVGLGLPEGGKAESDLGTLVEAAGNGSRHSANTVNELISAFRRSFLSDQVKTTDPYVEGEQATFLRDMFGIALEAFRENDVAKARGTLEQAVRRVPDSPAAHFNLSLAYEAEGKMVSAISSAETYLQLAPGAHDAGTVRNRIKQLREQQRERPHAIFDPNDCQDLYRWGQQEASRVKGKQRVAAYTVMTAAQRGDCATAETEYERYVERYGSRN